MVAQSLTHAYPQDCAGWGSGCLGSSCCLNLPLYFSGKNKKLNHAKLVWEPFL
jgi:hypothetical protein